FSRSRRHTRFSRDWSSDVCSSDLLVRNADESEDLLQETFIAVFSEIDKLGRIEQVGAWIRRIAMNRSISHLRRKKMSFEVLEERSEERRVGKEWRSWMAA